MFRLWLALTAAAIAVSAFAQVSFDERDSIYALTGQSTSYTDITYDYTMQLHLHSAKAAGEDYMWDWSQKIDAQPTPPDVSSDVSFTYVGKMLNGKYRYVLHLKDNAQHYIQFNTRGAIGASFANSWIVADPNPGDGHSGEMLFEGGGFITSPAALYKVTVQLPEFIQGEGIGELQAQVLSETTTHSFGKQGLVPYFVWQKANASEINMDLQLHGLLVPEPGTAGVCLAGLTSLAALLRRRR